MTPRQYYEMARRVRDEAWPCKYGHPVCSDTPGGDCLCEQEINAFGGAYEDHDDCPRCSGSLKEDE